MEVVGVYGEFLEVTPAVSGDGFCAQHMVGMDTWEVTLYVERAVLPRFVTRTVTVEFSDGTVAEVAPGVPLGAQVGEGRGSRDSRTPAARGRSPRGV
jgi:hypothetical protein